MTTAQDIAHHLSAQSLLCDGSIILDLPDYSIAVRSNDEAVLEQLGIYFAHTLGASDLDAKTADCDILVLNGPLQPLDYPFTDWSREPGKTGRKDAIYDLRGGRMIRKVRTGMVFLQSPDHLIAAGPCLDHLSQVINFINSQYMNFLQQQGALICHAAGFVSQGQAIGIAGFSGGGKSTLMLHMMGQGGISYLTNDRLFIHNGDAVGIPKLPRINPGTIVHDPNLHAMVSPEQLAAFQALPTPELWDLEDKHDAFVEDIYGEGSIAPRAPLSHFVILNWQRQSAEPTSFTSVTLADRPDLLPAIMKPAGPFYMDAQGQFNDDNAAPNPADYQKHLQGVQVYEVAGQVDFQKAVDFISRLLPPAGDTP